MAVNSAASPRHALSQFILLAAGLVVLTLISATSVYLVNKAREDASWVLHSLEVENEISLAQLQMRRAESAQRGFLLTQRPEFRTAFEEAASLREDARTFALRYDADRVLTEHWKPVLAELLGEDDGPAGGVVPAEAVAGP